MRHKNPMLSSAGRSTPSRVAVIGAGTIGPDIAYYLTSSLPDVELSLVDIAQERLDAALRRIEGYVEKGLAKKKLTTDQADRVMAHLSPTLEYDSLAKCEWVIEAATENLALKREIFNRVEATVGDDAIITSNTSSLPASWMFSDLRHPHRATVTHFFAPAFQNPIVEVVDWERADPEVVDHVRWLLAATGKVPLVTSDVPCFMLDRIFDNWCNEAGHLLGEATAAEIDSVAEAFVHAGPFFVLNLANGNPIIVEANTLQMNEEGLHYRPAPVFSSVNSWSTITPGQPEEVDPAIASQVRDRMLGILFSQSVDILDRGIGDPADLELGCELALGFKKGPLRLMAQLGEPEVTRILGSFVEKRRGMPLPARPLKGYRGFLRHVLVDDFEEVKVLTIRRPGALNALDDEVNDELLQVIQGYENDPAVGGFVITGYGNRAFSAGADIGRFAGMLGDTAACIQYARDCSRLLLHLDSMAKPVVAALNGMALGGGLELAFRCHGIVALEQAWLQLPEVTLGIAPGIGALVVPYRRWPEAAPIFHDMLRGAAQLGAIKAKQLGIIDALASDPATLMTRAVTRVRELSGRVEAPPDGPVSIPPFDDLPSAALEEKNLSAEVIEIIERAITSAASVPRLREALEIGYAAFADTAGTEAARRGITAFTSR